jgi:DNA-binding transcriptional LysR family regulator
MLERVTLDQLTFFIAVVESGSFSAAARRLGRVQSAVSQAIKALESELDVTLFDRARRDPTLTDAGTLLLVNARRVLEEVEVLRSRARDIAGGLEPRLTVVTDGTLPDDALTAGLSALDARFPNLSLVLLSEGSYDASLALLNGKADLALFPLQVGPASEGLSREFLGRVRMIPVVASTHPLASINRPVSAADRASHRQMRLVRGLLRGPVSDPRQWYFGSQSARLDYVLHGLGWGFMPHHQIAAYLESGLLKQLVLQDIPEQSIDLYAIYQERRIPGRAARFLIEELKAHLHSRLADVGSTEQGSAATALGNRAAGVRVVGHSRRLRLAKSTPDAS